MRKLALLLGLLSAAGTGVAATGCEDLSAVPVQQGVQWDAVWQAMGDSSNCTQNCHIGSNPSADLDLSNRSLAVYFLVTQPSSQSSQSILVDPGRPRSSLLFQKLNCAMPDFGGRMPPGGRAPVALQALVYDWIRAGAPGENPKDPIVRDYIFRTNIESGRDD